METATIEITTNDPRFLRGQNMIENGIEPTVLSEGVFNVPSQTNGEVYTVMKTIDGWTCSCPDHYYRWVTCKHIYSVLFWLELREKMYHPESDMMKSLEVPEAIETPEGCIYCHSSDIVKNGSRKTKMGCKTRYLCHTCGRSFSFADGYTGFNNMKFSPETVTLCLDLYFKGTSLRKITDHLKQFQGIEMSYSTISRWIEKYTDVIDDYVGTLAPTVSNVWHTDEMKLKMKDGVKMQEGGKWNWLWNVMDAETRFLLTNLITKKRNIKEAKKVFKGAKDQAHGQKPEYVVTDGLQAYGRAFNKEFYNHHQTTKHVRCASLRDKRTNNNKVERLNGTFREREKVMRGLENAESSQTMMKGFKNYYNFIRPHEALDGETPAIRAGLDLELGQNRWEGLIKKAVEHRVKNGAH